MPRVSVTPEEAAFIQGRIERFAEEAPEELAWELPYVRKHRALPLYVGWEETAGIRSDGELIRWSTEDDSGAAELDDPIGVKAALVLGAQRYPSLRRLIPSRPDNARDCDGCGGSGGLPGAPDVICQCGGIGWVDDALGISATRSFRMRSLPEIESRVRELARAIDAPEQVLPTFEYSEDGARPLIEVDRAGLLHYVVIEQGAALQRHTPADLDDLLWLVFKDVTFSLACDYELKHRIPRTDCRRLIFAKQIQLLGILSSEWADRRERDQRAILERRPFDDASFDRDGLAATEQLLADLRRRALDPNRRIDEEVSYEQISPAPLDAGAIARAEELLGRPLPPLLALAYQVVGNGGFGPGYGLLPLLPNHAPDDSVVGVYSGARSLDPDDPAWIWPEDLLPFCDWGGQIRSCVDCSRPDAPVLTFDPSARESGKPMSLALARTHASLNAWFSDWLNGVRIHDLMFESDPTRTRTVINPFTREPITFVPKKLRRPPGEEA